MNYIYDGTFEGFLTCVYEHYYSAKADGVFAKKTTASPHEIQSEAYQTDLLTDFKEVKTDDEKAMTVGNAIEKKISSYDLKRVYRVFCTEECNKEIMLLNYIRLGFKVGSGVSMLHSNPIVFPIIKAERRIADEVHRLCGLVRFSAVQAAAPANPHEILYACICPDSDVLEFLAPHFADRFKSDPFIIYDEKRRKALFAAGKQWQIKDFTASDAALLKHTSTEEICQDLWRSYFKTIAIKERENPRCQRNFMPVRYWKNLTEFSVNIGG